MLTLLFEVTNTNLLFGFVPESVDTLLFGIGLIIFAVSLRRVFNRNDITQENLKQVLIKINR